MILCSYESTSSEEEEEEDEGSSSDGSAAGGCSDSSEEEAAALEDTSDEERNINLDESDSDENIPAVTDGVKEQAEVLKEKYVTTDHLPKSVGCIHNVPISEKILKQDNPQIGSNGMGLGCRLGFFLSAHASGLRMSLLYDAQ